MDGGLTLEEDNDVVARDRRTELSGRIDNGGGIDLGSVISEGSA